ncbi:MAG: hypothetical protein LBH36_02580 [Candidatus Nomurabacteria bacterium]|jgi:hypothetical protein|nr:hypothetical protein [Candidatus Nomurabacteria bacterium]
MGWLFWIIVIAVVVILVRSTANKSIGGAGAAASNNTHSESTYLDGYKAGYEAMRDALKNEIAAGATMKRIKEVANQELEFKIENPAAQHTASQINPIDNTSETTATTAEERASEEKLAIPGSINTPIANTTISKAGTLVFGVNVSQQPTISISPEELKERTTLRNLNVILYVASFLLVAAAATFVGASGISGGAKLIGLVVTTIAMYIVGLVLHEKVKKLKPAAVAFIGTSLGIVPFIGVALVALTNVPAQVAWLITSIFGLAAYTVAAAILQSQVVAWLVMAFTLSLTCSFCATASLPVVWYFITLIGVSLAASVLSIVKPNLVPKYFKQPIEATGQIVTPIALIASLVVWNRSSTFMYEIVFGIAAMQYFVIWLAQRDYKYETATRLLVHSTLLIIGWDILSFNTFATISVWSIGIALLHAVFSLARVKLSSSESRKNETVWLGSLLSIIGIGTLCCAGAEHGAVYVNYGLFTLLGLGIATAVRLRATSWAYISLGASYILPFIIGRWLCEPALPWVVVLTIPLVISLGAVGAFWLTKKPSNSLKNLLRVTVFSHLALAIVVSPVANNLYITSYIFTAAAIVLVLFSYVVKHIISEVLGFSCAILATILLWAKVDVGDWIINLAVLSGVAVAAAGALVHHFTREYDRRNTLTVLSLATGFGMLANLLVLNSHPDIDATIVASFTLLSGLSLWLYHSAKHQSSNVKVFLLAACLCHTACNILIGALAKDVLISGYAFASSAVILVLTSYAARQVLLEGAGYICAAITASILLTKVDIGSWYLTITLAVASSIALIGTLVHHFINERLRRNTLLALGMATLGCLALNISTTSLCTLTTCEPMVARVSFWLLIGAAIASFLTRIITRDKSLQKIMTIGYPTYIFLAWVLSCAIGDWTLSTAFYGITAVMFLAASYIENTPPLGVVGNVATLMFVATITPHAFNGDFHWSVFLSCVVTGLIYYTLYIFALKFKDDWRKWLYLISTWVVLGVAVLSGLGQSSVIQYLAAITLIFGACTVAFQGYLLKSLNAIEGSVYIATAGLHWLIATILPNLNTVFYAHLWATVIACVVATLYRRKGGSARTNRLIVAAALVSGAGALFALGQGGWYQLIFLVEHLALLVAGALARKQWATWWGAVGAVAAVFYFIKDYMYLWLGLLGLILIGIVIWRLVKIGKKG